MTTTQSPYREKIEAEWEELQAKIKSKKADLHIWTKEKSDEWEHDRADFEAKLQEWRDDAATEQDHAKDRLEHAWTGLKVKWNEFVDAVTD